jgi:uncharacterized protein (TIGR03435 family)
MRGVSVTTIVLLLMMIHHVVVAQSTTARFEVVSLRPVIDSSPFFNLSQAAERFLRITAEGRLVGRGTITNFIQVAYGAESYEKIVPAESVASSSLEQEFEVRALPPESSRPVPEDVRAMTRQMLAERFGLRVRIDSELARTTVLRVIQPGVLGPGLKPATEGCSQLPPGANPYDNRFTDAYRRSCVLTSFDGRFRGTVTIDEFARMVSFLAQRPILNRTDLTGPFAIDVRVALTSIMPETIGRLGAPRLDATAPSDAPAFVDALRIQMGFIARAERQPIRLFVVERLEPLVEN